MSAKLVIFFQSNYLFCLFFYLFCTLSSINSPKSNQIYHFLEYFLYLCTHKSMK